MLSVAPIKQLIMEKLPASARIHQQSKELISDLSMQFLMQLAKQANEFCNANKRKTVCPDHVLDALIVSSTKAFRGDNQMPIILESRR